jgi:DNA invertase Pin-like site-specific DNA recombinase
MRQTKRAAMYVRMSTEHQQYSIINQADAIERYAAEHKLTIVKRFEDSGKSGLTLAGRPALRQLLLEVISTKADFDHVLVYDVSRWGRFQDADESAYYEYTCKKANISLHYCVEQFLNDGSAYSALIKALKRTMAAEYSRELSVKVYAAQARFAGMGFHQGGSPGYGFKRLLVDARGNAKGWLQPGERKGLQSDRILLVPGPNKDIAVVRQIFKWFAVERRSLVGIATLLNRRKIKPERCMRHPEQALWTRQRVHQILTNPKYMGTVVYNRTNSKLSGKIVSNPVEAWVRKEGAVEPMVAAEVYLKVQQLLKDRSRVLLDDCQILDRLSRLLKTAGRLSTTIINKDRETPCIWSIYRRFKSLSAVYELIGYSTKRDNQGIAERRKKRLKATGTQSLGDAILDAVVSGKLAKTFTLGALRAGCPGWSDATYGSFSAEYANSDRTNPIGLVRLERGRYRVVIPTSTPTHQPNAFPPKSERTQPDPQQPARKYVRVGDHSARQTNRLPRLSKA